MFLIYIDTTQYHHHNTTSCPCPMQSCPKNGHGTGPINNAKGPVSANNSLTTDNNAPITTASANNNNSIISCKIENILASDIRIKPENDKTIEGYDKVAIAPQPNYSLNVKVLEVPENSVSPSRGSIGIQLPPLHCEAVQPSELNSDNISLSQRKARIGKTMERERQQQILLHGFQTSVSFISPPTTPVLKQEYEVKQEMDVKKEKDYEENAVEDDYTQMSDDKMDIESDIKVEPNLVEEIKEDIIDEKPQESENSYVDRNTINLLNESSDECLDYSMDSTSKRKLEDHDDVIELSDNSTVTDAPSSTVKRRKLFEKPALITVKKSPPNSYKRLIKKSQPPPSYLTSSSKSRLITSNLNRIVNKSNLKRRCIFKSKAAIKKMRMAVKKRKLAQKKKDQEEAEEESCSEKQSEVAENESVVQDAEEDTPSEAEKVNSNDDTSNEAPGESHEDKQLSDDNSEYSGKSNIDMTIDRVAKGYFSESEILSRLSKYRKTKSQKKLDAKRSKSEGNRSKSKKRDKDLKKVSETEEKTKEKCKKKQKKKDKIGASLVNNNCNNCKDKNQNTKTKSTKSKDNKDKLIPIPTSTATTTTTVTKKSKKTNNKVSTIASSKARSKTNNESVDFVAEIDTHTTNTIAIQSPPTTPTKRKQTTDKSEKKKKKSKTNKITEEESSKSSSRIREVETVEASTNQNDNSEGIEILSDVVTVVPLIVDTILSQLSPLPLALQPTSTTTPINVKTLMLDETDVENNNDECFVDNNSKLKNKQQFQESLALYKTPAGWVTGNKVPGKRGRKGKFGNRKRHRLAPLEDIVIPRSSSIPRWSNGWQWEGEPYQAYVFLNVSL